MTRIILSGIIIGLASLSLASCSDNNAAALNTGHRSNKMEKKLAVPVKKDGAFIGSIETESYLLKLHRVFTFQPKGSDLVDGTKPRSGHKFIYLDVSLKNTGREKFDGGFLLIAMRITDDKGIEYKKQAAALAAYTSENAGSSNPDEYDALWSSFKPGDFHREVVYGVEVPADAKSFTLHMPTDRQRKDWKTIHFSL